MAALKFKFNGIVFEIRDKGSEDEERLVFEPAEEAAKLGLEEDFALYEIAVVEKQFRINGIYYRSIDPTDGWSRRRDYAEYIGGEVLEYSPVEYPADADF